MQKFKLTVVIPEKKLFEGDAESVTVPGEDGEMAVFAGHAPLLSTLKAGKVKVVTGVGEEVFEIGGGFVEVNEDYATVLAKKPPSEKDT